MSFYPYFYLPRRDISLGVRAYWVKSIPERDLKGRLHIDCSFFVFRFGVTIFSE